MELRVNSEAEGIPPRPGQEFRARSKKRSKESCAPWGNTFKRGPEGELPFVATAATGVFAVDKPAGITSHDVVDAVRHVLGGAKAGHAGTLDPQATGVLVLCLGSATKISSFLIEGDKEYEGWARLGVETDTQDATGKVVETREVTCDAEALRVAASRFLGEIAQVPPMYSAVKIGGQKLYRLARRGVTVERPARTVTVRSFTIESVELPKFEFRVGCSKGTYVRSLVHDLGRKLGCGGHLESLRRTKQGPFDLARAISWDELVGPEGASLILDRTVSPDEALAFLPSIEVEPPRTAWRSGVLLRDLVSTPTGPVVRLAARNGRTLAIARAETEGLRVVYVAPISGRGPRREAR